MGRRPAEFSREIVLQLFDLTQGIRGLAIPLMMRAQEDAIADGSESVTVTSLLATWRRHFTQLDRPMSALRLNNAVALAEWDDLCDTNVLKVDATFPQFQQSMTNSGNPVSGQTNAAADKEDKSKKNSRGKKGDVANSELGRLLQEGGLAALSAEGMVGVSGTGDGNVTAWSCPVPLKGKRCSALLLACTCVAGSSRSKACSSGWDKRSAACWSALLGGASSPGCFSRFRNLGRCWIWKRPSSITRRPHYCWPFRRVVTIRKSGRNSFRL